MTSRPSTGCARDWHALSAGLESLGDNYQSMADNLSTIWTGAAADRAHKRLTRMAKGHGKQAEAAQLMSMQMNNMLTAVKEACKLVANVLGLLEELLLSFSIAKWAKEVLTFGSGVRRAITLIDRAITFIKNLNNVIPPILKAAGLMAVMFRGLNMAFMLPMSAGQHADAANHIDDTANAGFGP
ncbi:WXG100 family type VII secretion target [Nocardioides sp. B-3]|uniref:WXG100 family type VII secretion target n=1 Tax=Nocardioides sp. B-3 TaxID=2895565 RepID=UPI003FA52343